MEKDLKKNSLEIIQSIINTEMYAERDAAQKGQVQEPPLVAVSRFFGANGTEISQLLAESLQVECFDKALLREIIKQAKADAYLMERLDERVTGIVDDMVHTFFSKKSVLKEGYLHHLLKVVLGISQTGGVIVGRGAHLLLSHHRVFRVCLEGSLDVCARRMAERLNIKQAKAEKLVKKTNAERRDFVKRIYKKFPTLKSYYDLVINTDLYEKPEQVVAIIRVAMKEAGFPVPDYK